MRIRSFVVPLLLVSLFLVCASAAFADTAPTGPAVLRQITFETPSEPFFAVDRGSVLATFAGPNWGRITNREHSGLYGLWCAGSSPASWPYYPAGTHGIAYLDVPDTTGWVTSNIQFYYYEPGVKPNDWATSSNPFVVSWVDGSRLATSSPQSGEFNSSTLPLTTSWKHVVVPRGTSVDGGTMGLARGWLRFQFLSHQDSSGSAEGVTIDDIVVSGYEFNAPRNVVAARQHGNLTTAVLNWDKPYGRDGSTVDSRDIYYRIWRRDLATNDSVELTTSDTRVHATTFSDTNVPTTGTYVYQVQAWEQTSTTGWGVPATSAQVGPAMIHFASAGAAPSVTAINGATKISGALVDEVGSPISGVAGSVVLQRKLSGGAWLTLPNAVSEVASGTYTASASSGINAQYRFYYAAGSAMSDVVSVGVLAYVTTPTSTSSSVKHTKKFTLTGKVSRVPVARTVTLRAYRKEGAVYVLRASTTVKVGAGSSPVSYKKSWSLKLKGTYHITATVADAYSVSTTSGYRTITVK